MEQMDLYDKLAEVPENAKRTISGGRLNGFTDINPQWRIEKLTEVFGPCGFGWWYIIRDQRLEAGANDEVKAFVDIELYVKMGSEVSHAIPGVGGSSFIAIEKGKPVTSDECFKMALTDAISVAAKALGLGADVYRGCERSKYIQDPGEKAPEPAKIVPLPKEAPPPPDIMPEPGESPDGYYYCDKCGKPIENWIMPGGSVMYPKEIAALSIKKFGKQFCVDCGKRK